MNPRLRAFLVTYLFSTVGLWSVFFHAPSGIFVVPHALFYAVLTLNTYFSVRFYSVFTPDSLFQTGIDLALAAAYICLALSIGLPLAFSLFALVIFIIAPAKYAHMIGSTAHDATLRRKILIDLLGTALCMLVFALTLTYHELSAAWIFAVLFGAANIYLLGINPMYRHVK